LHEHQLNKKLIKLIDQPKDAQWRCQRIAAYAPKSEFELKRLLIKHYDLPADAENMDVDTLLVAVSAFL